MIFDWFWESYYFVFGDVITLIIVSFGVIFVGDIDPFYAWPWYSFSGFFILRCARWQKFFQLRINRNGNLTPSSCSLLLCLKVLSSRKDSAAYALLSWLGTSLLASDWPTQITWPEYWPLIGQGTVHGQCLSLSASSHLWLVEHKSAQTPIGQSNSWLDNSAPDWPIQVTWPEYRPLIGQGYHVFSEWTRNQS